MNNIDNEWLSQAIGTPLSEISALVYEHGSTPDYAHPQKLVFEFGSKDVSGCIYCDNSGSGLIANAIEGGPQPVDMGEFGSQDILTVSNNAPWNGVIGMHVQDVMELWSEEQSDYIGFTFYFQSKRKVHLLNNGDELVVFSKIPDEIHDSEKLTERKLRSS